MGADVRGRSLERSELRLTMPAELQGKYMFVALGCVLSAPSAAVAETLRMECGASEGYSYAAGEGLNSDNGPAWSKEEIPGGVSIFELDVATGAVSYSWKHFSGTWHNADDEGIEPQLVSFDERDRSWQVVTRFSGGDIIEVCTFSNVNGARPKALCTTSKNTPFFTSARVLISDCEATILPSGTGEH